MPMDKNMEVRKISACVRVVSFNGWHTIEVLKHISDLSVDREWVQASEPMRSYARTLDTAFQMI